MKVCVIGGTGHIGKNLIALLDEDGCDITVITSGRTAVPDESHWNRVTIVQCQYGSDDWADCLRKQDSEVLIDILGSDAPATYEAAKSWCRHFILCGSVWMFGAPRVAPTPDVTQGPCMFEGYAVRYAQMQTLQQTAARDGIAFSAVMPPNICGPGKVPLEGHGGRDIQVHQSHQRGEPVALPQPGLTLIGPCDAFDVAQGFFLALQQREAADGQIFNVGSEYALTAQQFIDTYGEIYGCKIPIQWCSWKHYAEKINPSLGGHYHFKVHMCPDLTKIKTHLGYKPRYTPEQTLERAVAWMKKHCPSFT